MKSCVGLLGPYDAIGKKALYDCLGNEFDIREAASEQEYEQLRDVDYVVLRTLTMDREAIASLPRLKFIQRWGVGYNTVDIEAAGKRNIQVGVAAGVNSIPVAEYAILLILSIYRHIIPIHENVRNGTWRDASLMEQSYTIQGKKLGIIGIGSIGREVAKRGQAFGAEVIYHDAVRLDERTEKSLNLEYRPFKELMAEADIISLHLPFTEATRNLVNKEALSLMKKTACLINTARGGIVDERALSEALQEGRILGAGLDVFEDEPVRTDNPLLQLKNVVLSAHSAGNTVDNSINMAKKCAANIRCVHGGGRLTPPDLVNGQILPN